MSDTSKTDETKIEAENLQTPTSTLINKYIPMKNGSKNLNRSFKVPFANKKPLIEKSECSVQDKNDKNSIMTSIDQLKAKIEQTDNKIEELKGADFKVEELDSIISKLHDYNEIKDTVQTLLERIAHIKGVTIRQMHKEFDIEDE